MCLMNLKESFSTIKTLIHEENKIVSGPLLSRTLEVSHSAARRLLEQYVSEVTDKLAVFYLVSGSQTNADGYKVQRNAVVPKSELSTTRQQLESPSQQVFAVTKVPAPSLADVVTAASSSPPVIKFKIQKKTGSAALNGKGSGAPAVAKAVETKPEESKVKKEDAKPEVKKEVTKPAAPAKPLKNKRGKSGNKSGDVRSMFSKQVSVSSSKPATPKVEAPKPTTPPPKERSPFDSESEEEIEEKKPTLQPKRRRIMALSDSEDEPEPPVSTVEPMEEDELIPPTPPTRTKRSFQTVSQTFQDEDGFMVTKKEKVIVEEEEPQPIPEPSKPKKAPKPTSGPKKQANIMSFFGKKA